MDDMEKHIEKLIRAGIDAVSEGFNITREAVGKMTEKGELLDQACSSMAETAEKVYDAVANNIEFRQAVDDAKRALLRLNKEQLTEVQGFISRLIDTVDNKSAEDACADNKEPDPGAAELNLGCTGGEAKQDEDISPLKQDIPESGLGPNDTGNG